MEQGKLHFVHNEDDADSNNQVASMNCKRSAVGAVAVGDHLYVCGKISKDAVVDDDDLDGHNVSGGFDGLSSLDTVERFDPEENKWSMVS